MEALLLIFKTIALKDIFDILLVTIIIYQLTHFIQRTRALQMVFGLSILLLLFISGQYFKLNTLNWILGNVIDKSFLILIILFQDQIRQWLAKFGKQENFLKYLHKVSKNLDYEEIVDACLKLKSKKVGALIVIEREHGLHNYIQTGTKINSNVHSEILQTIFNTSSPLHDGAVIISGNKLMAAGCFLTLSRSSKLDKAMGTRHRAAMGLCEETDALTIVVSEETGKISVFYNKNFIKLSNDEKLFEILRRFFAVEDSNIENIFQEYKNGVM